ncbi:rfaE bifunctional protein, domain I/rfaE bifunctional protein, domain II [Georgenia satyanarayanai]|uniref:RfaE bifunctional protein, domain I/rfaE bifunctional protein, domain II n=1 Tax=Georgenia satyanarayanai TaxID=860221 RepID=A0A2Y9ANH8_9MICO|nr:PfkB family carbohydrate kinase [Georgenia satyanarayanai]PYF98987.1 rfaE bifunctional protein kinase chain/domain/rfaE bifunctional protein nucleotidyltransferase chain/domain [Georgenia satyanarayanai]SSA43949.1 rfaE bifunctional protein, domain I/rfaE bifunctional protein, domain II [Georgenia satyanarayanai]
MSAQHWIDEHRAELETALGFLQDHAGTVEQWAAELAGRLSGGARLLAAGNGGSAAEAQHLTSELVGRFLHDRRSFSAISLCSESSSVSAIVNDYGAEEMFARQVEGHGRPGDVLVLLSTSGKSPNVLRAAERGRELGLTVWGLTGPAPNPLAELCDDALCVEAPSTAAVQEGHLVAIHALCAALDRHLGVGGTAVSSEERLSARRDGEAPAQDGSGPEQLSARRDGGTGDSAPHVVVVGDVVLDADVDGEVVRLSPDAPVPVLDVSTTRHSPGGAGLAALLCTGRVTLVAPIADDEHGDRLVAELEEHLTVLRLPHEGATRRKTRIRSGGQSLVRVDDGGPGSPGEHLPLEEVARVLASADAVLVSDYGAGTTRHPGLRELLAEAARRTRLVWDPHPRGGDPVPGAALVTPNLSEARSATERPDAPADVAAAALRTAWRARGVCVTAGADGAFLAAHDDETSYVPAVATHGGDPCGAGDRFAASAASALASGALLSEAVESAVADASAWVAAGGAEGFRGRRQPVGEPAETPAAPTDRGGVLKAEPHALRELATRLRGDGATVVATGGCFDIVHAGHVATLQAARRLGDRLVVLMNSDASVTRLKGQGRPVVPAADRAKVLEALDCVDAVVVFDDDDPRGTLTHLRPDIWAKGGDYGGRPLPETEVVQAHGGRVVLLPYLGGRSTTSIINRSEQAAQAAEHARSTGGAG